MKKLQALLDVKAIITALTIILTTTAAISTQVGTVADIMAEKLLMQYANPAFKMVEFDLMKQMEKLQSDPSDIKFSDIEKFAYFCDTEFGGVYIPASDNGRALTLACGKITDLYADRFNS